MNSKEKYKNLARKFQGNFEQFTHFINSIDTPLASELIEELWNERDNITLDSLEAVALYLEESIESKLIDELYVVTQNLPQNSEVSFVGLSNEESMKKVQVILQRCISNDKLMSALINIALESEEFYVPQESTEAYLMELKVAQLERLEKTKINFIELL
jgi:hypothetical protein